ncbi:hypothetical protein PHISP_05287 [Aspergillus sp. HF37]|nr:hypothetical protein PHISP_05287 [Aspergillus sp. HF37]
MPWLYEAWSSDPEPYHWATVTGTDLKEKQDAYSEFRDKIQREREVIREEMLEAFEEWVANEPVFEYQGSQERREMLKSRPIRLPRERTNWYRLYRDIRANWDRLKGLQNRARIWNDVTQIIERIEEIRYVDNPDVSTWKDFPWYISPNGPNSQ